MNEISKIEISYEKMRTLVIDCIIIYQGSFDYANLRDTVANKAVKDGIVENPFGKRSKTLNFYLQADDAKSVQMIIEDLINEGILKIGNYLSDKLPFYSFTEKGLNMYENKFNSTSDIQF